MIQLIKDKIMLMEEDIYTLAPYFNSRCSSSGVTTSLLAISSASGGRRMALVAISPTTRTLGSAPYDKSIWKEIHVLNYGLLHVPFINNLHDFNSVRNVVRTCHMQR